MSEQHQILTYNSHLERLIAQEGEKALAFRWLHAQSEQYYSRLNTLITLPVIVLSTVNGFASGSSAILFKDDVVRASIVVGLVSIVVGVLQTITNFFGWSRRAEGHRVAGLTFEKLYRFIQIELSLPREQRLPAKQFIKQIREQIDRLNETAPAINRPIIKRFRKQFKDVKDIAVPEITNGLHKIEVYPVSSLENTLSMFGGRRPVLEPPPDVVVDSGQDSPSE